MPLGIDSHGEAPGIVGAHAQAGEVLQPVRLNVFRKENKMLAVDNTTKRLEAASALIGIKHGVIQAADRLQNQRFAISRQHPGSLSPDALESNRDSDSDDWAADFSRVLTPP
jgi:hypothetical protein